MRRLALAAAAAAAVVVSPVLACSAQPDTAGAPAAVPKERVVSEAGLPRLTITRFADGLDHPWAVQRIGKGQFLVTERDQADLVLVDDGQQRTVDFPSNEVWVSGETGLMGLAVDPDFAENRTFYTCQGATLPGGGHDVRVVAWSLNSNLTQATRERNVITGFPTSSGRHGGCQLLITRNGSMLVGTGDSATTGVPRSLGSLGGKTLRLDPQTGKPWPTNPYADGKGVKRYIQTSGHRNVQGLAERRDGTLWSVEQGTYRDDEVNLLRKGGDYGWEPGPGYDESPPMTDQSLPGRQIPARWRSGNPTFATSGADFTRGKGWGSLRGALAVGVLKDEELLFVKFDPKGRLQYTRTPAALKGDYGRLRGVTALPNGSLLVTTDNGNNNDVVLKITPS